MTTIQIAIRKAGRVVDVDTEAFGLDWAELPSNAQYVFRYGLTQSLNDAHAAESVPNDDAGRNSIMAIVEKKLDAIVNGTVRVAGSGGARIVDPIARLIMRYARDAVAGALKAAGKKVKDMTKEQLDTAYTRYIEKNTEALKARAERELADNAAAGAIDVDDLFADEESGEEAA